MEIFKSKNKFMIYIFILKQINIKADNPYIHNEIAHPSPDWKISFKEFIIL
jgi:hypothetical protein